MNRLTSASPVFQFNWINCKSQWILHIVRRSTHTHTHDRNMNRVIRIKLTRPDYSQSVRQHFSLINAVDLMEMAWSSKRNVLYSGVHVVRCSVEKGNMSHTGRVSPTLFPIWMLCCGFISEPIPFYCVLCRWFTERKMAFYMRRAYGATSNERMEYVLQSNIVWWARARVCERDGKRKVNTWMTDNIHCI